MPIISLCCPVYQSEKFLSRAIESILDQDLQDWELIICMDGYSREAKEIIGTFKDKRIKSLAIEHGGACKARNEAAKLATGKYVAFFSSDFQAVPGMLRKWVMTFDEHPEADFVYGGYMFPDKNVYPGEQFDPRQLETYNYIDGGFPLKREIWEKYPWDEKIKSLNDWDFWLRIVKAGHKGYFMRDYYSYIAEYPRQGGLSYDSANNWIERVKQVKRNNDIPLRDICVASLGAEFHAKRVAKMLNADFMPMPSFKPHEYKMIYLMGFYSSNAVEHARVFQNTSKGCRKVIHWLGTDILQMASLRFSDLKLLRKELNSNMTAMFAESQAKVDELSEMGINAEVLPVLRDIDGFKPIPMPEQFTVAVYIPSVNVENYHPILMDNIAKNMPDVRFIFYGDRNIKEPQKNRNIEVVGWKDIKEIIAKSSCLLRYTGHDGLPTAPMEFALSGRYVITNAEMPHVIKIDGNSDQEGVRKNIIEKIREVKNNIKNGILPDGEAEKYYRDYLDPEKIKNKICGLI